MNSLVIGFLGIAEHFDDGAWSIFHVEIINTFGVAQASFLHRQLRDRKRESADRTGRPHRIVESSMARHYFSPFGGSSGFWHNACAAVNSCCSCAMYLALSSIWACARPSC